MHGLGGDLITVREARSNALTSALLHRSSLAGGEMKRG